MAPPPVCTDCLLLRHDLMAHIRRLEDALQRTNERVVELETHLSYLDPSAFRVVPSVRIITPTPSTPLATATATSPSARPQPNGTQTVAASSLPAADGGHGGGGGGLVVPAASPARRRSRSPLPKSEPPADSPPPETTGTNCTPHPTHPLFYVTLCFSSFIFIIDF